MKNQENIDKDDKDDKDDKFKLKGFYRGLVVDDEDPRDIGRVKVRIPGIHRSNMENDDLPWVYPALGIYRSGGVNLKPELSTDLSEEELKTSFNKTGSGGMFTVPARGNHVWIFFDNGNHMQPHYWATAPCDEDWLIQKQFAKDKIESKIEQILNFKKKFTPEDGTKGFNGIDWADGGHINTRQNISGKGEKTPYKKNNGKVLENSITGKTEIKNGAKYDPRQLNINNSDDQGKESFNMNVKKERSWGNEVSLDIKPLLDKQTDKIDRENSPHKYDKDWKMDKAGDNEHNINRYITSFTTQGGTTIIIDNREEQENFYLIHKNFIENIDQDGSRKVFIGQNDPEKVSVRSATTNDARNKGPDKKIRSNDELGVTGDKKIHVLGNFITYTKGNVFTQVDKNMQIDVNDTYGVRVKKGDFDIIIEGETEKTAREQQSEREDGKEKEFGDLNISIKKGNMELFVKQNANIHVEGQANLLVDGEMRTHVKKSHHLYVEGDSCEFIKGNKYVTVQKNVEFRYNADTKGHVKTEIFGDEFKDVHKDKHLRIGTGGKGNSFEWIKTDKHIKILGKNVTQIDLTKELKVGKSYTTEIGNSYDCKVGSNIKISSGGMYNLNVSASIIAQSPLITMKTPTVIATGLVNIAQSIFAGGAGVFGSAAIAPDFLGPSISLSKHTHTQTHGDHFGTGGITTPPIPSTGGKKSAPKIVESKISSPSTPNNSKSALTGENKGGGETIDKDPDPINIVFSDEPNELESLNKTKISRRKHKKRKEKIS